MEEKTLVRACIEGDRKAQKYLFDTYAEQMLGVCLRYAQDHTEAEDMLQEGFIRVFKNLDQFAFKGSFEGWVRRVIVNTSIKGYYRNQKHRGHLEIENVHSNAIAPVAEDSLQAEQLMELVQSLPDGYRMVFNLYAIDGYSHKEIADLLGIEESTSRSQLVKARRVLQDQIIKLEKIAV